MDFKPPGWPTLIPRLFTHDVEGLATFLREVLGAVGEDREAAPTELRIGEAMLMISDGGGLRDASRAFTYVYVPDVDAAYQRGLAAGARSIEAPQQTPYGDRRATLEDRWGNTWQIATRT